MELTEVQRAELRQRHRGIRGRKEADRIKAMLMLADGLSCDQVGRWLLLDGATVRRYRGQYLSGGVDSLLCDGRKGFSGRLTVEQLRALEAHLSVTVYRSVAGVVEWVRVEFGVCYTPSGMAALLGRMGYVYKRPVRVPGKADPWAQREFIERYGRTKASLGRYDRIYFLDGVHPLHNSVAVKGWVKRGRTVHLRANTGRSRVNINGALQVASGKVTTVQGESVNAQSTLRLIRMLLQAQPRGKLHLVLDNARYYHSKLVKEFVQANPRIELMFLPPYSPNLNVIERLWKLLKAKVMGNPYHPDLACFKRAVEQFFREESWLQGGTSLKDNFQVIEPMETVSFA